MNNTNKILSVALNKHNVYEIVQVDTVTTGGMYSFEVLGIPTKHSVEVKQKVYTSLRSKNILNIKSDNRKIYSSVASTTTLIEAGSTELALLVSCYGCITKKDFFSNSLIIGRINITGDISSTKHLIQSLHLATQEGIKNVICPLEDFNRLSREIINHCHLSNIKIQPASSIYDLFNTTSIAKDTEDAQRLKTKNRLDIKDIIEVFNTVKEHPLLWPLVVSICGNHDLLFYTNKTIDTENLFTLIESIHPNYTAKDTLNLSHVFNLDDESALKIPYFQISDIMSRENKPQANKKDSRQIKQLHLIPTCLCKNTPENCTCNIRNKKFYREKVNRIVDDLPCIRAHIAPQDLERSVNASNIKTILEDMLSIETVFSEIPHEALLYTDTLCTKMSHIDKKLVLEVAKTIHKIDHYLDNTSVLTKKTILLAFSLIQSKF